MMIEPLLLSIKDAADVLGIGRSKLYQLIQTKQIVPARIGSRTLVPVPELHAFVERVMTGEGHGHAQG